MANGEWYYARNNQQQGPITLAALQDMARSGQLQPGDLVWRDGKPNWLPAGQVPELFAPHAAAPPPAPGYAPPPAPPQQYAQPGYYPSFQRFQGDVPTYLWQSIVCTLLCCLPFGIVAIVYASQVGSRLAAGDYHGATDASEKAKLWCWVSFGLGLLACGGWFVLTLIGIAAQPPQ